MNLDDLCPGWSTMTPAQQLAEIARIKAHNELLQLGLDLIEARKRFEETRRKYGG